MATPKLPLLLVLVLAAACGSTVQDTDRQRSLGGTEQGLSPAGIDPVGGTAPTQPGAPQLPGAVPLSSAVATALQPSTPAQVAASARAAAAAAAAATGTSGPGVTAKEVYVGFIHDVSAGAVNEAAGIGAITSGDANANTRAVINDINDHGGVGGRKLVAVFADFDSTSTQTLDQQYAAVCQKFTRDSPRVFAVENAGNESYRACLAKAGVTVLDDGLPTVGQEAFTQNPLFLEQGYANVDRLAAYQVTPLVEQRYFTPWNSVNARPAATGVVKVGVLTYNDRVFSSAVDRYLVPALKRLGYTPVVAKIAQVTTAADYSGQAAAVKSAQLSFAANGVTHVIPFESNGGLSTLFRPTARSQGYYPRYGISTASAFEALMEAGIVEARQLNGAVGFGWFPSVDLRREDNPATGWYSNKNRRYCLAVMSAAGITFDSGNAEMIALGICADLYLLKAALDRTPTRVTGPTLVAAAEALGTSYQPAGGLGQEFRTGRHDPSNKAYHWRYVSGCTCLQYEGSLHTIP